MGKRIHSVYYVLVLKELCILLNFVIIFSVALISFESIFPLDIFNENLK